MKKIFLTVAAALCLCLSFGIFAACGGGKDSGDTAQSTEYKIVAQSDGCVFEGLPSQAKEGENLTFTVSAASELQTVASVFANDTECTRGADGAYSFTMPAKDVQVSASLSYVQKEILSDDVLSWRSNVPSQVCKAQEADTDWARQIVYFDFSSPRNVASGGNVTLTSLNPDIIPQSALSTPSLHKLDTANGFCDYGSFEISLGDVSLGTAYIAVHAKTSSGTSIDATIIKKIEVVEYGKLEQETWQESVEVDLSEIFEENKDQGIKIQISDQDHQYGGKSTTATVTATADVMTVFIEYIPSHNYSITVYYGEGAGMVFFSLNESVTQHASYQDGKLVFTQEGASISVDVRS